MTPGRVYLMTQGKAPGRAGPVRHRQRLPGRRRRPWARNACLCSRATSLATWKFGSLLLGPGTTTPTGAGGTGRRPCGAARPAGGEPQFAEGDRAGDGCRAGLAGAVQPGAVGQAAVHHARDAAPAPRADRRSRRRRALPGSRVSPEASTGAAARPASMSSVRGSWYRRDGTAEMADLAERRENVGRSVVQVAVWVRLYAQGARRLSLLLRSTSPSMDRIQGWASGAGELIDETLPWPRSESTRSTWSVRVRGT